MSVHEEPCQRHLTRVIPEKICQEHLQLSAYSLGRSPPRTDRLDHIQLAQQPYHE